MIKLVLMHKFILLISIMFFSFNSNATEGSFYDFDIKSISGEKINLSDEFDVWKCMNKGRKKCLSDYRKSKVQFLNAAQCLINSSNICMAQISHLVGLETQKRFLQ